MNRASGNLFRKRLLAVISLGLLAVYALLSVGHARSAAERLSAAETDLREVSKKLAQIERLRQAPKVAALQFESPAEIANRVAAARQAAGLPQSALLKEQPLEPVRIDRTDFELRATNIDLTAATVPQIVAFCDALRDESTGSVVRDIRLDEPDGGATGGSEERWEAQLVLTQMIFSPKSR